MREYDLIAEWYAAERLDATGVPEVLQLASSLPRASLVLDIGCGNGVPITRCLLEAGHRVVGIDTSGVMLSRLRRNMPGTPAVRAAVQHCPFANATFDAAVAWGVLFHLPQPEQHNAIASVSRVLRPGAPFLFTSGDVDGPNAKKGSMNGVMFQYFSFSVEGYRRILAEHGFTLVDVHADAGKNTYYLAKKEDVRRR